MTDLNAKGKPFNRGAVKPTATFLVA